MPAPKPPKTPTEIALKPLREHVVVRFEAWVKQTPDQEAVLRSLQERALSILAGDSATFEQVQERLEGIVEAADALDDGHAFAASQKLTSELESLSRAALSIGVPVFPELAVGLRFSASGSQAGGESAIRQGSRTKLGGQPDWIQTDETPICERCSKGMTFVAQIDSLAHETSALGRRLKEEKSFMFADVGMIYVFWCSKCYETRAVLQSS